MMKAQPENKTASGIAPKVNKQNGTIVEPRVQYTLDDCGCYVDGARGIYAPERIIRFANEHGAEIDFGSSVEDIWDSETDADDYMNAHYGVDGASWGRNENGDWGLWTIKD